MTDRELLQQALDMLDDINQCSLPPTGIPLPAEIDHVMEALRARLAQPEQVIYARKEGDLIVVDLPQVPTGGGGISKDEQPEPTYKPMHPELRKMYEDYFDAAFKGLAPLPREWVGLTKEDLETIHQDLFNMSGWSFNTMAKAIEAKLKQKNT